MHTKIELPKAFSVRDEHEFCPIQHLMERLNPQLTVKQVATGVHVDGGTTVFWGLVYLKTEPPSKKKVEIALREAGFDFAHNILTQMADDARRMAELQRSVSRWERECLRQQALARALQRAVGLSAPVPGKSPGKASGASPGKKARCRKPVARALKAAATLRVNSSSPAAAETVQPVPEHVAAGVPGAERDRSGNPQGPSREDHGHGPGRKEAVSP